MMNSHRAWRVFALLFFGMAAASLAWADPPEWAGKGKGKGYDKGEWHGKGKGGGGRDERRVYFGDQHRGIVHDYYGQEFRSGRCPPGLAKKNNGCMPPGQARKWQIGRPLPRDVIYYEVPPALVTQIGPPPPGYRYVRVGADILMLSIGTAMVADAIADLGRR